MSKVVAIHQPDFLPHIGFFHKLAQADLWVIFDNVQFLSGSKSYHNRDKIKTAKGTNWVTVAVQKCPRETMIDEVLLSTDVDWRCDNINLIRHNYREAQFFEEIFPHIERLYDFECEKMIDFNLRSIEMLNELFDVKVEARMASSLKPEGKKNELLVDICKKAGASTYLSGVGAKDYFEPGPFEKAGIKVVWQEFEHPVYTQLHGGFVPYMSSIDLLFNCGIEASREFLRGSA